MGIYSFERALHCSQARKIRLGKLGSPSKSIDVDVLFFFDLKVGKLGLRGTGPSKKSNDEKKAQKRRRARRG